MAEQETLKWRARGDKQFDRAFEDRLPAKSKVDLLEKAHHCYSRSHDTAHDHLAAATATHKCMLTKQCIYHDCDITDFNTRASALRDLVNYLQTLHEEGCRANLGVAFCADVQKDFDQYVKKSLQLFREMDGIQAVWWMEEFVTIMRVQSVKCSFHKEIFERLHERSKNEMEKRNYGPASGFLQECKNTLDKVSKLSQVSEAFRDWIIQKYLEIKSQHTEAKALFTMVKADELLDELKKNYNAETDLDSLYEIIDTYTKVIQMTENQENEVAAEAYNRLGKVFTEMIKDKERGKMYFRKSMALAKEFWPADLINDTTSTQQAKSKTSVRVTETPKESTIAAVHYPKTSRSLGNKADKDQAPRTHPNTVYDNVDKILHDLKEQSKIYKSDNNKFLEFLQKWYPPIESHMVDWFHDTGITADNDDLILRALQQAIQDYGASLKKPRLSMKDISIYVNIHDDLSKRESALMVRLDKKRFESEKKALALAKETMKQFKYQYKKNKDMYLYIMDLITTFPPQHRSKQIDWSTYKLNDPEDVRKAAFLVWRQYFYNPDEQKDQTTTWQWVSSKIHHILQELLAGSRDKKPVYQKGAFPIHSERPRILLTQRRETKL